MHNATPLSTINIISYSMVRVGYGGKQNLFGDRGRFVNAIIGRTLGRSRQPSASISSDRPRLSHSLRYPNTAQNSDKLSAVEKSATTDPWDQSEILDNKMHRSLRSGRHSVADSSSLIIALILFGARKHPGSLGLGAGQKSCCTYVCTYSTGYVGGFISTK